jgi:predicted TIM-barrel fold metal-dependent hydrolase
MSFFHGHDRLHPRRRFLRKSFEFLGALATAAGVARGTSAKAEGKSIAEKEIPPRPKPREATLAPKQARREPLHAFDAHLHCPSESGNVWQWHPVTRTFEEFVRYLDRTGVQRGIINSVRCQEAKTAAEFIAGNREVARYAEKYKGRFLGACVVNPLFIDEALREIENCRKQLGFVWVGELCNYMAPFEYTIKEFELLVAQVVKLNMVLDVHTELEEMEYIIQKFPQATIVFPHFGDGHEYEHIFKRIDAVAAHPNTYLDTSGYGHDRVGMLEYAVKTIGDDRVLFPATVIARIENAFLTEEQKRKILSENLKTLLRKTPAS